MNRKTLLALAGLGAFSQCWAVPIVSNVRMQQIDGTKDVRITYDLADNINTQLWIDVSVKPMTNVLNWGTSTISLKSVEGDAFRWVAPGLNKEVVWHAGLDWNGRYTDTAKATVKATIPNDKYGICRDRNLLFSAGSYWRVSTSGYEGKCAIAYSSTSVSSSTLETKVVGSGTISYRCKLSTSVLSPYGFFVYVDGVVVHRITGTSSAWTSPIEHKITTPGLHTIVWEYYRGSTSFDAYVDCVEWREEH